MAKSKNNSSKIKIMKIAALVLSVVLVLYFICFFIVQFINYKNAEIKTEVAVRETIYKKIETKCFVLRDESFIENSADGTTVSFAGNGQRIAAGDTVSVVFNSPEEATAYLKMNEIEKDIKKLEAIAGQSDIDVSNIDSLTKKINNELYNFLDEVDSGNFTSAVGSVDDYSNSVTSKQIAVGQKLDVSDKLEELRGQLNEYKSKSFNYTTVLAESSGYYINGVDGYEKTLNFSKLDEIDVKQIENAIEATPDTVSDNVIGRSVGAFKWYILCVVDTQDTVGLSFDKEYYLNFPYNGIERLSVSLYKVGDREQDKVALVFCCDQMNEDLADLRIEDVEIITEEYTGLKVPTSAIREVDGVKGVYIVRGHLVGFRTISVIYPDGEYTLVKKPEDVDSGYIRLYDIVISEGVDLADDKLV